MPDLVKELLEQWAVIAQAPLPFVISLVTSVAIVWGVFHFVYRTRFENMEARLEIKDDQIELVTRQRDEYLEKLGGASPDQAKARIEELEKRVNETIGSRWEPLTSQEVAQLSEAVAVLEKRRIQVMYAN